MVDVHAVAIVATGDGGRRRRVIVGRCLGMDEFEVETPEGMLDFFLRAADDVHRYISRLTGGDEELTEDIVQEAFLVLLRHHRSGDDSVMGVGWLMTAARHRLLDHVRARQRERTRIERHSAGVSVDASPVDTSAVSAEQARWLLAQLPLRERVALGLHTVDGLSVEEVARLLDRGVEATTSLLARARRRLRRLLEESADA